MFFLNINLFGQIRDFSEIPIEILEHLDKMGIDSFPLLNKYESEYFNFLYKDFREDFNFTEKKIGFLHDLSPSDKKEYFDQEKERFKQGVTTNNGKLYVFDEKQKEISGGYDAAIVYWCKMIISKDELTKRLKYKYGYGKQKKESKYLNKKKNKK